MKAGQLRHRIECFSQQLTPDGCGGFDELYVSIGKCWAKVTPQSMPNNEEQYHDRANETVKQIRIRTRNNIGFTFGSTDVITFNGLLFRIQGISDIDYRGFKYELYCYEIERDEVEFGLLTGLYNQAGAGMLNQAGLGTYNQAGV